MALGIEIMRKQIFCTLTFCVSILAFTFLFSESVLANELDPKELKDLATEYHHELGQYYFDIKGDQLILYRDANECDLDEYGIQAACNIVAFQERQVTLEKIFAREKTIMAHTSATKIRPKRLKFYRYSVNSAVQPDLAIHILKIIDPSNESVQYRLLKVLPKNGKVLHSLRLHPIDQVWQTF